MDIVSSFMKTNQDFFNVSSLDKIDGNLGSSSHGINLIANHLQENSISENVAVYTIGLRFYVFDSCAFQSIKSRKDTDHEHDLYQNLNQYIPARNRTKTLLCIYQQFTTDTISSCNIWLEHTFSIPPPHISEAPVFLKKISYK